MAKNYRNTMQAVSVNLKKLRKDIPDTLKGFASLAEAATREGVLDKKTKELIAVSLGVAARCDACIGFHVQSLIQLGGSRAELEEALSMAVLMGGGPSLMYAADALGAYDELSSPAETVSA